MDEFEITGFAKYYDELSDTFIDIRKVAASLKQLIPVAAEIFEIGLGTGYFAGQFLKDGYTVCGIQPKDKLLDRLKRECSSAVIKKEDRLECYDFDKKYNVIVSHSSVFLFTRLEGLACTRVG
jgi:SAM-dependent methyltransferase